MEKRQSKEEKLKELKRQEKQKQRNTKIKALKVDTEKGEKQLLVPGSEHMVGLETANVLVKAGRAEIVK